MYIEFKPKDKDQDRYCKHQKIRFDIGAPTYEAQLNLHHAGFIYIDQYYCEKPDGTKAYCVDGERLDYRLFKDRSPIEAYIDIF